MRARTVVAIAGLPTSGKSVLGRELARVTGLHFVDIDEGPAGCAPPREENPYRSDVSRAREQARMKVAYTVLHAAVEANLAQDFSVIVSATYSRHSTQDFLQAVAEKTGGNLKVIWCKYNDTPEEIERRVVERVASGAVGGCRSVSHYLDDRIRYAGIKLPHIVVATEGGAKGLEKAVNEALVYIEK